MWSMAQDEILSLSSATGATGATGATAKPREEESSWPWLWPMKSKQKPWVRPKIKGKHRSFAGGF